MDMLIILIAQIALALSALRWGVNSTDGINSPEWERRQRWYGSIGREGVCTRIL
jgi:hypothetical protein